MAKSDRPKLSLQCDLEIEAAQRGIHALYWQELRGMQQFRDGSQAYIRTPSGVPQLPPASKSPAHLRFLLGEYASRLFHAEASRYPDDRNLSHWLKELQYRVELSIFERLGALEREAVKGKSLDFHGLSTQQKQDAIKEGMRPPIKSILASREKTAQIPNKPKRAPSAITSLSAAQKVQDFVVKKHIGMTEFAIQAGITDRTLRSFRKTGKLRRSLVEGIAKAMGITKEELLS